ncbi:MAG TPA: hypothetical protein VF956_00800 [Candidatus Dormibacteraeota bacterium]
MATTADFKTSVLATLDRLGNVRVLGSRDALLLGQTATGSWKRLRIPAHYSWMEGGMVSGFVRHFGIERLAILVSDDFAQGRPRRLRLLCLDRASTKDETLEASLVAMPGNRMEPGLWALSSAGTGARLAKLAHAARTEWSGVRRPIFGLLMGRPWPLAVLVLELCLVMSADLLRIRWVVAGAYNWLPMIPLAAADVAYALYLGLIGATVVSLWRQTRLGYVLALCLAAVQFVRPIAVVIPVEGSMTARDVATYLAYSWIYPAAIVIMLGLLTIDRKRSAAARKRAA